MRSQVVVVDALSGRLRPRAPRLVRLLSGRDPDPATVEAVAQGVVDQVADRALHAAWRSPGRRAPRGTPGSSRTPPGGRFCRRPSRSTDREDLAHVVPLLDDLVVFHGPLQAGKLHQALDEPLEPRGLLPDDTNESSRRPRGLSRAPWRSVSAKPRIAASGVLSSCDAWAAKSRRRFSSCRSLRPVVEHDQRAGRPVVAVEQRSPTRVDRGSRAVVTNASSWLSLTEIVRIASRPSPSSVSGMLPPSVGPSMSSADGFVLPRDATLLDRP